MSALFCSAEEEEVEEEEEEQDKEGEEEVNNWWSTLHADRGCLLLSKGWSKSIYETYEGAWTIFNRLQGSLFITCTSTTH